MSDSHFPKAVTMEIHILQNQVSEVEDGKTLTGGSSGTFLSFPKACGQFSHPHAEG